MSRTRSLDWRQQTHQRVRVYRNLLNGMMSVQVKGIGGWRVVGHVNDCVLAQVSFTISESGRQRVIRDRVKNVHAYAEGMLVAQFDESIVAPLRLGYDPYRHRCFVERESQRAIVCCSHLVVRDNVSTPH